MPESELLLWQRYAIQKGLPHRRLEIQSAIIAHTVAATAGNVDLTIGDFMLDKKESKKVTAEENAMALGQIAGGVGFRKLGQGRKKK